MNRKDRIRIKYKALRDAGFNSTDAKKFKNNSWRKIQLLVQEKVLHEDKVKNIATGESNDKK